MSDRVRDAKTGEWNDTDPSWYTVIAWRQLAENVAESVRRGDRVIVTGRMQERSYDDDDGNTRYVWELIADEIGMSMLFNVAYAKKAEREKPQDEVTAKRATKSAPKRPTRNAKSSQDIPF